MCALECICSPRLFFTGISVAQFAGVTVDRSFDIWSFGMAVLHLHAGKSYFQDSSDPKVGNTHRNSDLKHTVHRRQVQANSSIKSQKSPLPFPLINL